MRITLPSLVNRRQESIRIARVLLLIIPPTAIQASRRNGGLQSYAYSTLIPRVLKQFLPRRAYNSPIHHQLRNSDGLTGYILNL